MQHFQKMFPSVSFYEIIGYDNLAAGYDRAFYYDSLPVKTKAQSVEEHEKRRQAKQEFFDRLKVVPNMHVRSGVTKHTRKRGLEQKGVDVQFAIDVYRHAVSGNIDVASLIAGDLDFLPLLEALVQTRVKTELRYDAGSTAKDLIYAADVASPVHLHHVVNWMHPKYSEKCRYLGSGGQLSVDSKVIRKGTLGKRAFLVARNDIDNEYIAYVEGEESYHRARSDVVLIDYFENVLYPGEQALF